MKTKPTLLRQGRMEWQRKVFVAGFLAPTLIMFCIFYLYPLVTVFVTSFCKWDYSNIANPEFFGFKDMFNNYQYIFTTYPYFWEAVKNSSIWALLGVFFQIPVSTLIALAFSRKMRGVKVIRNIYIVPCMISSAALGMIFLQIPISTLIALAFSRKMRGVTVIRNIYIVPCMISSAALGMIFLQLYSPLYGIVNPVISLFKGEAFGENILLIKDSAFIALTCAYIFFTGTTTLMILGNIMAIPQEVREAAYLDGASGFLQDLYITIPMIKGTLKTVSVLAATSGFLLYNEVFFLTKGAAGTYSISYVIRELAITSPRTQFGRANAVALIQILGGMLIILIVNIVYAIPDVIEKLRKERN